tara:strand:+ start:50 stop:400 length:351 start_codon:yes stop_codon:yes gene_type:complete
MLYGRLILIGYTYYNKILDVNGYSYFVALNRTNLPFIKIMTENLDKKTYIYGENIVIAKSNRFTQLISIDTILSHTPFVKGNNNNRKNYYLEKMKKIKKDNSGFSKEYKFGTIHFE